MQIQLGGSSSLVAGLYRKWVAWELIEELEVDFALELVSGYWLWAEGVPERSLVAVSRWVGLAAQIDWQVDFYVLIWALVWELRLRTFQVAPGSNYISSLPSVFRLSSRAPFAEPLVVV